jgi:hypothetical protein
MKNYDVVFVSKREKTIKRENCQLLITCKNPGARDDERMNCNVIGMSE